MDHLQTEVPIFYICPISLEIMNDPVTLSTGITYNRDSIEKWLFSHKKTVCPVTKQVVTDIELTPNHTLRRLIQSWLVLNPSSGIQRLPTPHHPIIKTDIIKLLKDSKSPHLQTNSLEVADPMQVTSLNPNFFMQLVQILNDQMSQKDTKATLKVLIHVSAYGRNRIKAAEAGVVPVLIDILINSTEKRVSEMVMVVLDRICECAEGRAELLKHAGGLAVVSKKIFRVSSMASERAVKVLYSVAKFSGNRSVVEEMLEVGVVGKLCLVVQVDCGIKMKENAREILKMHARVWKSSCCIPCNLVSSYPS